MAPKRTSKVANKASVPPTAGVRKSSRARATSSEPRQLRSNSEEPQALQVQDPEQIMRQNKRKNKQSSRASSRASTQEPEENIAPSSTAEEDIPPPSTPEDVMVHPTTEIDMDTAPDSDRESAPESDRGSEPQQDAQIQAADDPMVPASASSIATAPIDQFYPHHNLSLILEEPTEESILATQYTRTTYTRGTFAETVVELSSESDEGSADGQQEAKETAYEREYDLFSSPFQPACVSTPLPLTHNMRELQAQLANKDLTISRLEEKIAALEATTIFLTTKKRTLSSTSTAHQQAPASPVAPTSTAQTSNSPVAPSNTQVFDSPVGPSTAQASTSPVAPSSTKPTDVSTPPQTKSLFSIFTTPFKSLWGSSSKASSPTPDFKVNTSLEASQIPSFKPKLSSPKHKSPRTPSRPIQRAKSHTHNTSKTVIFNVMRPRANSEDPEHAPTPVTIPREPWQIFSYRRRRAAFLVQWEAWQSQEQARIRSGLPETESEQKHRRIMENKRALVDKAIAHSKKQQAINKAAASATPRTTQRLTTFNVGTKRNADTVVTNEGSPMKKQRLEQETTAPPASIVPHPESSSRAPKEPEQPERQLSPGRTFEAPPEDDVDMSEAASIGKTFAFPDYSSSDSDSEDEPMGKTEVAEPAKPAETPVVSEATQKKRKLVEDEEQELARREEENVRRALRIAETDKELNRLHAEQVEKQKAAAAATPPVPAWTQPPPPTPSPQHAQLPKPAPAPSVVSAPIPAPQNKYAPKKPSRLRESTTYSPVRKSIEADVITIPTPQQHGSLFNARYPTPPDEDLEQGMQALLSVVKFVTPLSGR